MATIKPFTIQQIRLWLTEKRSKLESDYYANVPIHELVTRITTDVDTILQETWSHMSLNNEAELLLIAVGGYGRSELLPYSDIDLLVLSFTPLKATTKKNIENFISFLWDIGLEIGHSVRTLEECVESARSDITIISNIIEARLLCGDKTKYERFKQAHDTTQMWPSSAFFQAKFAEQLSRYHKYDDTSYNLEPDVKNSPGGLRDIHTIAWVAKRHFGGETLQDLMQHYFLTEDECQTLQEGQEYLWKLSFGLHFLCQRRESRLLFDNIPAIAKIFGVVDDNINIQVETFMRGHFRKIKILRQLNDMLLQFFREAILSTGKPQITIISDRFQICDHYIEARSNDLFQKDPSTLFEIFLCMSQHPEVKGVRASTIRAIQAHRNLIDEAFRNNPKNQQCFLSILRHSPNVAEQLQRMNRYGLLEKYCPIFKSIVGQMQYDLFHAYTVDQHIIFLLRNIARFRIPEFRGQFPLCSEIMETITKPEILYIAALFHDIAKGRGGDHSTLGAQDALDFCLKHHCPENDIELIVWLVKKHLIMSQTAQRKDIYDPETIQVFSQEVLDQRHLDHLYLLTVADICATNPNLWNSWRDSLLSELYTATTQVLSQQKKSLDEGQIILEKQQATRALLSTTGIDPQLITTLWKSFKRLYFLREAPLTIAWHTQAIIEHQNIEQPLVLYRTHFSQGATEIFSFTPNVDSVFLTTTTILTNLNFNIVEARISITLEGYSLATYIIMDENNQFVEDEHRLLHLRDTILRYHQINAGAPSLTKKRVSRQLRHFRLPVHVVFNDDTLRNRTIMQISCSDRSGVLARIAKVFYEERLYLQNAKIATMGEQVEDVFYITDHDNNAIRDEKILQKIRQKLIKTLAAS